jgi:hypothetical protein
MANPDDRLKQSKTGKIDAVYNGQAGSQTIPDLSFIRFCAYAAKMRFSG